MNLSVVVSTYNQPEWLSKVLHGYLNQTHEDFEVIIADDGSDERTRVVVQRFQHLAKFQIKHVWQEDDGFQKTRILNKSITAATADYLVFTDGDCIPRRDFLAVHARHAAPRKFLSGGYCKLSEHLSHAIDEADIRCGSAFELRWLRARGFHGISRAIRIATPLPFASLLDAITPTKATWNGHNASGWKADILAVNGFNELMQYGGEDRELGERLTNLGVSGLQIRHRAITLHLDHQRGYATQEAMDKNRAIRDQVIASHRTWCPDGIEKRPKP